MICCISKPFIILCYVKILSINESYNTNTMSLDFSNDNSTSEILPSTPQHTISGIGNPTSVPHRDKNDNNSGLSIKQLMGLQSEINGKFSNCESDIKLYVSSLMIHIKDVVTVGATSTSHPKPISDVSTDINEYMKSVVDKYENTFAPKLNSYIGHNMSSNFNVNRCPPSMLKVQSKKRLMTDREKQCTLSNRRKKIKDARSSLSPSTINGQITRSRVDSVRKCSFCKQSGHNTSNCSKRQFLLQESFGRELKSFDAKSKFIQLMKTGPRSVHVCSEQQVVIKGLLASKKPHHIFLHTSFAKEDTFTSQFIEWSMSNLLFEISLIECNGIFDENFTRCLIEGVELEHYISTTMHSVNKYIYNQVNDLAHASNYIAVSQNNPNTHTINGKQMEPPEDNTSQPNNIHNKLM